jgi:hypothetical protein
MAAFTGRAAELRHHDTPEGPMDVRHDTPIAHRVAARVTLLVADARGAPVVRRVRRAAPDAASRGAGAPGAGR